MEILQYIETHKAGWTVGQLTVAYGVLDAMNNAGNNMYVMFIDPDWDPGECPLLDFD